jgi:hypothetical protein
MWTVTEANDEAGTVSGDVMRAAVANGHQAETLRVTVDRVLGQVREDPAVERMAV